MPDNFPRTAQQAISLWDDGKELPAFQVESEAADQDEIWGVAIEIIRAELNSTEPPLRAAVRLTEREYDVAKSIAAVVAKKGWAAMLQQHTHSSIASIIVRRPEQAGMATV